MSNDTNTVYQSSFPVQVNDRAEVVFQLNNCDPVADRFSTERECFQCVTAVTDTAHSSYAKALFSSDPGSDETFCVAVPPEPFSDTEVRFESISISNRVDVTKHEFGKRAATLAFVTRLAVSIPTGDLVNGEKD